MSRILNPDNSGGIKLSDESFLTIDILKYDGSVKYDKVGSTVKATGSNVELISKLNHRTFFENNDYYYATESESVEKGDFKTDNNCEPYIFSTRGKENLEEGDPKETYSQANRGIEIGGLPSGDNEDPNLKNWSLDGNVNSDGEEGGGFKYNYGIQCTQEDYKSWAFGGNKMKKENKVINASRTPNGKEYETSRGFVIGVTGAGGKTIDGGTNIDNLMSNSGNEFSYNIGAAGAAYSVTYDDSDYVKQLIDENGKEIAGYGKNSKDGKTVISKKLADGTTEELIEGDAYNLSNTISKSYNSYQTVVKPLSIRNLKPKE